MIIKKSVLIANLILCGILLSWVLDELVKAAVDGDIWIRVFVLSIFALAWSFGLGMLLKGMK